MSKEILVLPIDVTMIARLGLVGFGMALMPHVVYAEDAEGCVDHPLVGRFEGASIAYCKIKEFDELVFMTAPSDYGALWVRNGAKDRDAPEFLKQQGKASEIRYELPNNRSSLEVVTNYEASLKAQGFETVFACADQACFTGNMSDIYLLGDLLDPTNGISTAYFDHGRYLFVKREQPDGAIYASVIVGEANQNGVAFVRVLEAGSMDTGKVTAISLATELDKGGRADLYGILFDYDQDSVKPESKPALDEIAKVLMDKPDLRLKIIGHTDNVGGEQYNFDLSTRRAANVSAALVGGYGIDPARLSFEGAGLSRPIETNDTDEGRAKNRRVEVVVQ